MEQRRLEELKRAYDKEKDHRVVRRMLAVYQVHICGKSAQEVADDLWKCPDWMRKWVRCFDEEGIDALRDLPRCGRKPKTPCKKIDRYIENIIEKELVTPAIMQVRLHEKTGIWYHQTTIRRFMRRCDLSPKKPTRIHINRASKSEVKRWQCWMKRLIPRLEKLGFMIFVQDESIFILDAIVGRMYWSKTTTIPYTDNHSKAVVYGAISNDGSQMFQITDSITGEAFVQFLKDLHKRFGKIAVLVDRSKTHSSEIVKEYLNDHKDSIKLIFLPKGSPQLSAIEECWHQIKQRIMVSKYYLTLGDMRDAIFEFCKTVWFKMDIWKYVYRKYQEVGMNI